MYADDTQLYMYLDFSPEDEVSAMHATIDECVKEIKAWLSDHFFLLNENNTEAMTVMPVNQPAVAKSIKLGDVTVPLSASLTNLRVVFDKKRTSYVTSGRYANGLLHNAPIGVIKKLDRVQRSSARELCRLHKYQRISMTEVLHDLHRLPLTSRIKYKLLIVTLKVLPRPTRFRI